MTTLNTTCIDCFSSIRNWRGSPRSTAQRRPTLPRPLRSRRTWRRTDTRTLFHVSEIFCLVTVAEVDAQSESLSLCTWERYHCLHSWPCWRELSDVVFSTVDHSRVRLSLNNSKNDTDYINANFIQVRELYCTCHSSTLFSFKIKQQRAQSN